jgi:hypothetical protein
MLCGLLAIAFWGMYHLLGFDRFVGRKAVAALTATTVLWLLAVTFLIIALHDIDSDYSPQMTSFIIL